LQILESFRVNLGPILGPILEMIFGFIKGPIFQVVTGTVGSHGWLNQHKVEKATELPPWFEAGIN
jgi:hypothetical protein